MEVNLKKFKEPSRRAMQQIEGILCSPGVDHVPSMGIREHKTKYRQIIAISKIVSLWITSAAMHEESKESESRVMGNHLFR